MKLVLVIFSTLFLRTSFAEEATQEPVEKSAAPAPYVLPWQLRPAMIGNAARIDSAVGSFSDAAGNTGGAANASMLTLAHKFNSNWAGLFKIGTVDSEPPGTIPSGTSFTNPALGAAYSHKYAPEWTATYYLTATLPVGSGSGNTPDAGVKFANGVGALMRSAMDNSLFAVNYFAVIPGFDVAYVSDGWTIQYEATLFQLWRVKGENIDHDAFRTNFTTGVAVNYSFMPLLGLASELRYQRWLANDTVFAAKNPAVENMTFATGPRFQFKVGDMTFKPGIAYVFGMMGAISSGQYTSTSNNEHIVFIDLPISF